MKPDPITCLIYLAAAVVFAVITVPVFFDDSDSEFQPSAGGQTIVVGPQSFLDPVNPPLPDIAPKQIETEILPPELTIPVGLRERIAEFESTAQETGNRTGRLRELAREWAQSDPVSGVIWSIGLTGGEGHLALREILRHSDRLPRDFARETIEKLAETPGGFPRNRLLAETSLLRSWAEIDPATAWERFSGSPNAAHLETVLSAWVETDPESVSAKLSDLAGKPGIEAAEILTSVYGRTARRLADTNPKNAIQWISSLPEGSSRAAATGSLIRSWLRQDPETASSWLDQLPNGPAKDAGITHLVLALRHQDPEAARLWAETISEESAAIRRNLLAHWESAD